MARLNPIRAELVVLGSFFGQCGVALRAGVPSRTDATAGEADLVLRVEPPAGAQKIRVLLPAGVARSRGI